MEESTLSGVCVRPDRESISMVEAYVESVMERSEVPMKIANKMNIAVDEIYSNIVFYSGASWAQAVCVAEEDRVTVILRDDGAAYNPLEREDPDTTLSVEERGVGGLGIFMVKKLMSEISYRYQDGKNEVTMSIQIR